MSKESETTINKMELLQYIEATVAAKVGTMQLNRTQAVKETSLLHYLNLLDSGKDFLRSTADLGLAVVDAGLAIPTSLIKSEIVIPSLSCDSIDKWLRAEKKQDDEVIIVDK